MATALLRASRLGWPGARGPDRWRRQYRQPARPRQPRQTPVPRTPIHRGTGAGAGPPDPLTRYRTGVGGVAPPAAADACEAPMTEPRVALTYDDVLLVPRRSRIRSRQDVSVRSRFSRGIDLEIPIVSANMDTVTTAPMAIAMAQLGGIGVIHRFLTVEQQAAEVGRAKRHRAHVVAEPYTIDPAATVAAAAAEAARLGVTGLLVVGADRRPLGILTARDMRAAEDATVAAAMTPAERLVTAPADVGPDVARKLLDERRIEKLPLVDADGRLAGLITLRDLSMEQQYPLATR